MHEDRNERIKTCSDIACVTFCRTKRMVVDVLKVQPGDNLTEILYTPATAEQVIVIGSVCFSFFSLLISRLLKLYDHHFLFLIWLMRGR